MVYKTLEIILGFVVSKGELEKLMNVDSGGYPEKNVLTQVSDFLIKVYTFPCCSPSQGKKYIIGIPLHTYYRMHGVKCNNCTDYFACNTCIGITNNGFYDVIKIFNKPVKVDINKICLHCFSDKQELNALQIDLPIVNNRVQGDLKNNNLQKCNTCGILPDNRFTQKTMLKKFNNKYSLLKEKSKNITNNSINFYYMIDDCLSCT